ncbi:hypothetical protein D3C86_1346340 [compost metagenome]
MLQILCLRKSKFRKMRKNIEIWQTVFRSSFGPLTKMVTSIITTSVGMIIQDLMVWTVAEMPLRKSFIPMIFQEQVQFGKPVKKIKPVTRSNINLKIKLRKIPTAGFSEKRFLSKIKTMKFCNGSELAPTLMNSNNFNNRKTTSLALPAMN